MRGKKAFTLVELLVVISIIALLVGLLFPALARAKELAKRSVCASNLGAIGKTTSTYATEFSSFLPTFNDGASNSFNVVGKDCTVAGATNTACNSRGWFILCIKNYTPAKTFRCPSDTSITIEDYGSSGLYDFKPCDGKAPISFGLHVTKVWTGGGLPTSLSDGNVELVIAGDRNGLNDWSVLTATVGQVDKSGTPATETDMNSPNHNREGQNVMRLDASVAWKNTPLCGPDKDNIYTRADGSAFGLVDAASLRSGSPLNSKDTILSP